MKSCTLKAKRACLLITICLMLAGCNAKVTGPPNIIVILADDLGWSDTAVYGSQFYDTPSIDQLANQGIRFTQAYAASPVCSPTRASILTGLYPARIGMTSATAHLSEVITTASVPAEADAEEAALTPVSITRLPQSYVTYAELLKEAGYQTAFMGKWHLGHPPHTPESQGFDVVVGGRAHPGPPPPGHFFSPWNLKTIPTVPDGSHIADVITDAALSFIETNQSQPFLLNLWYYDVHAPYQGTPELIEKYRSRTDGKGQDSPVMGAMIEKMDTNIGRVIARVAELGLEKRTVIIFMSDNGGNMYDRVDDTTPTDNAPLRSGKGNNYEGGVRVPLIVSGGFGAPEAGESIGTITKNQVSDHRISSIDLFPTILQIAGIEPTPSDGHSFFPTLIGETQLEKPVFSHFPHYVNATQNLPNTSVIEGHWKLYKFHFDGPAQTHRYELYNLATDISETTNIAIQHPELVARMATLIEKHLSDVEAVSLAANPAFIPAE